MEQVIQRAAKPSGKVGLRVIREVPNDFRQKVEHLGRPQTWLPQHINDWREENTPNLDRGLDVIAFALDHHLPTFYGSLGLKVVRADGFAEDLGLASLRVVTTVGVNFMVDAFQNLTELENFKYHGIGTGAAAEGVSDTALGAELGTQYSTDNVRATGSQIEGGAANIYRTVGTNTVDAAVNITEHGLFTASAAGTGTLFDRSVFASVALASGDSLQTTYDLTISAGG